MSSSKLSRIFGMHCPSCGQSDLFNTGSFSFKQPFEMPQNCNQCHQSYFPEPGFYYGAMFISYIIFAFFSLGFLMVLHWVIGWSLELSFIILLLTSALLFVYLFRISRSIWLGLMVSKKI